MEKESAEKRIQKIAEKWFLSEPLLFAVFCTHRVLAFRRISVPFRVGKMRIEYNPDEIDSLSDVMTEEKLKIEVIRILLKHPYQRLPSFANKIALAIASDITISDCYKTIAPLATPHDFALPKNLCFEEYYAKLTQNGKIDEAFSAVSTDDDGNLCINRDEISEEDFQRFLSAYQTADLWEENEDAAEKINSEIEKAQFSGNWGTLPGNLVQVIEANMKVKMDYRRMLNAFRSRVLSSERCLTRNRPNRRYGFENMGSRYAFSTKLLIAVDVSGSVSDTALSQFFSIINRFFKYGIQSLDVIQFDAALTEDEPISLKKAKKSVKITGRGGTNFQIPVDYYEQHPEYDGLIIFTDGCAPSPNQHRFFERILWVFTSRADYDSAQSWISDLNGSLSTYIPS